MQPFSMDINMPLTETKKYKKNNSLLVIILFLLIILIIGFIIFIAINIINNFKDKMNNLENELNKLNSDYYTHKSTIFSEIFPIGSYYISSDNKNPSQLFGGQWEQIKDRFIIGASDKYKVGSQGGEEKHKLTGDEMPSHRHNTLDWAHRGMYFWGGGGTSDGPAAGNGYRTHAIDVFTSYSGGNAAHNNIPPYKAAFIWRRIA